MGPWAHAPRVSHGAHGPMQGPDGPMGPVGPVRPMAPMRPKGPMQHIGNACPELPGGNPENKHKQLALSI